MRLVKILSFLSIVCMFASVASAQETVVLSGRVFDSLKAPIPASTATLIRQQDSVMLGFAITDAKGAFSIDFKDTAACFLEINCLGYGNFRRPLDPKQFEKKIKLDSIILKPELYNLDGIDITETFMPIQIIGDTILYEATAFETPLGSTVEDLLKKLPGVEVEADGTIKSNGEEVKKVLVDGKEFFGNDTRIASKNLPADIVDQVKVYDQKSDIADFTGVDDGNGEKTINLLLKEGKKKGTFGNLEGNYGSQDRYKGKGNLNRFNKRMRLSLIGNANNINEQTFTVDDYISLNGGLSNLSNSSGPAMLNLSSGPDQVENSISNRRSGGLNFNYELSKKLSLSNHYFFYNSQSVIDASTSSRTLLDTVSFSSQSIQDRTQQNVSHRFNSQLKYQMSDLQDLTVGLNLRMGGNKGLLEAMEESTIGNSLQNQVFRNNQSEENSNMVEASLRFKRRSSSGRGQWAFVGSVATTGQKGLDGVRTETNSVTSEGDYLLSPIAQDQWFDLNDQNYQGDLSYTRKFTSSSYLIFRGVVSSYSVVNQRDYYDLSVGGPVIDDSLSNYFRQGYFYQLGGVNWVKKWNKVRLSTALNYQRALLDGNNLSDGNRVSRTFGFWLPSFRLTAALNSNSELRLVGWKSVSEPTIDQLQPLVINNDPLRVYEGNPALIPESSYALSLNYRSIKRFNHRYLFARLYASLSTDNIVYASSTDVSLKQVFTPVNANAQGRINCNVNYRVFIRGLGLMGSVKSNISFSDGVYYVNGREDRARNLRSATDLELGNKNNKKVDISAGVSLGPNRTTYLLSRDWDNSFLNMGLVNKVRIDWKGWTYSSELRHRIFSGGSFSDQRNFTLLNFKLLKEVAHGKGTIQFTLVDALNQNTGIDRSTQLNVVSEQINTVLGRYFLLGFRYKLSRFGS